MKRCSLLLLLAVIPYYSVSYCALEEPFTTGPVDCDGTGTGWTSDYYPEIGDLSHNGKENLIAGSAAGSIFKLFFAKPFTDGPGDDFAIETVPASIAWGYLADEAEFSFYMDSTFIDSFTAKLNMPGAVFTYELPGENIVANKIFIKNLATYQGNWGDTSIVYADAGVAYTVPEPATVSLLALGGLALLRKRK